MRIFLDANILIAEGHGTSALYRVFLKTADDLDHEIYVPKLVIEEVIASYERTIKGAADKIESLRWTPSVGQ